MANEPWEWEELKRTADFKTWLWFLICSEFAGAKEDRSKWNETYAAVCKTLEETIAWLSMSRGERVDFDLEVKAAIAEELGVKSERSNVIHMIEQALQTVREKMMHGFPATNKR